MLSGKSFTMDTVFVSLPLFLLGVLLNLLAKRYGRNRREAKPNRISAADEEQSRLLI